MTKPTKPTEPTLSEKARKMEVRNILKRLQEGKTISKRQSDILVEYEAESEPKTNASTIADTKLMAEMLGVKGETVSRLADQGILKKAAHGKYYMVESVRGYINHIKGPNRNQHTINADESYQEMRRRKMRIETEIKEMERAEKEGTLIAIDEALAMAEKFLLPMPRLVRGLPKSYAARCNPKEPQVAETALNAWAERYFASFEKCEEWIQSQKQA